MIGDQFRPPRRPRRRRRAVFVVLTIVIGIIVAFALAIDNEGAPPLFAEDLRRAAEDVALDATAFNTMVIGIGSADRVTLDTRVGEVLSSLEEAKLAIATAPADDPQLVGSMAILSEAVILWETGVTAFRDLVFEAADDPLPVGLDAEITSALIDLRTGDRLYSSFLRSVTESETSAPVVPYPVILFVSETYPLADGATQIVAVARAVGNRFALRSDLAIEQVATLPEMVLNTNDANVIGATDTVTVQVVIDNQGNAPSEATEVSLNLQGTDDSNLEVTEEVAALEPGTQTTVEFVGVAVAPGFSYQATLLLSELPDETDIEGNAYSVDFTVNEQTSSSTSSTLAG